MIQYIVKNYKIGVDLAPLTRKLEYMELSSKEPGPPPGPRSKGASDIAKKI